ncbi:hypothetical protein V2J09_013672, partial [Rumex salicifolius]
ILWSQPNWELLVSNSVINWSKVHSYNRSFNWQFGPNFHISDCNLMERLDLRNFTHQIKALGILVAVLGAFVVTLYKQPNWPLGCSLLAVGLLLRSIWNTLQDVTAKIYPDEVTIVFFCNLFGKIQSVIVSFFLVKGTSKWQFNSSVEIITFSLCVFISTLLTWCLRKKGPVFVSMFDPLNVALVAFMGSVFLADGIYLGSVIGSTVIIVGFYAVMWGQAKTTKMTVSMAMDNKIGGLESGSSTSHVTPLCCTAQRLVQQRKWEPSFENTPC